MTSPAPFGIYVHAPWCRVRCPYCAFNIYPDRDADWDGWAVTVRREWSRERAHFVGRAHSLYLGGGTPSLAPPSVLASLVAALPLADDAEVTVEVNPGTVDGVGLQALVDAGVNRLSLGIQTFTPRFARLLNRGHTVGDARELTDNVAALGLVSWSLDLIFALPDQTVEDLDHDIVQLLEAQPPHVSLYGLTFEPGTPLDRARSIGRIKPLAPDLWRQQYDHIRSRLQDAGLDQYEVSNFARPGHRSRHNQAVWRGGHYAGLGPGAHGFRPDGRRTTNHGPVEAWMADVAGGVELPTRREAACDHVLSTLRHTDGLDLAELATRSHHAPSAEAVRVLGGQGLLIVRDGCLRLTEAGVPVADGVVRHLCASLLPARDRAAHRPPRGPGGAA